MSALEHLRQTGRLNDEAANLLYDTVARVVRSRNFPPPTGHDSWTAEAIQEAAHEFLVGPNSASRLLNLALLSTDEDHFARRLWTAVLNHFRDLARKTTVGKVVRKVREIASEDNRLDLIPGPPEAVAMASRETEDVYNGTDESLIQAAAATRADVVRWQPETNRGVPFSSRDDLLSLLLNVLTSARSAVELTQLSRVVARRFNLSTLPNSTETDTLDPRARQRTDEVEVGDQAAFILQQLTDRERRVLPLMDLSVRDAGAILNLSRSTVAREQARIRDILERTLPDGNAGEAILRLLVERVGTEAREGRSS